MGEPSGRRLLSWRKRTWGHARQSSETRARLWALSSPENQPHPCRRTSPARGPPSVVRPVHEVAAAPPGQPRRKLSARRVRGCGRHRADWKPRVHARGRLKGRRSSTGDKAGAARRGGLEEGRPRGSFSGVQSRTLTEEGLCQRPHGLQFHRTPPASRERACPRAGPAPGHFLL